MAKLTQTLWQSRPGLKTIFDVLGYDHVKMVGGFVRDVMAGHDLADVDIDLATTYQPDEVIAKCQSANLKTIPTGIDHGTVTILSDGAAYEITTLRRDVKTDGRHAEVAFTNDWQEDAARRDLTINALYVDWDGNLFDPFQGADDLAKGLIRFVGNPAERVQEDYLRILRFFRFFAFYGKPPLDEDSLAATEHYAAQIQNLSVERITKEFLKLLTAADPIFVLQMMADTKILERILGPDFDLSFLPNLIAAEKEYNIAPFSLRRLAAITGPQNLRLRFSNQQEKYFANLCAMKLPAHEDSVAYQKIHYEKGDEFWRDLCLLHLAHASEGDKNFWRDLWKASQSWTYPAFPLNGDDLQKAGILPGPEMGALLARAKDYWFAQNFTPDRDALLSYLKLK